MRPERELTAGMRSQHVTLNAWRVTVETDVRILFRREGLAEPDDVGAARELRAQAPGDVVRRVLQPVFLGHGPADALHGAVPARRARSLRHRDRALAARTRHALAALRLPLGRRQGQPDRPGGGARG